LQVKEIKIVTTLLNQQKLSDSTLVEAKQNTLSSFDGSLKKALDYDPSKDNK
jgi:hypothetical protein